ncbi:hypothetical protein GCM10009550_32840 [Actinocorallia libanotica]|uniref:Uncharacterized protein n=1 Tax=Actinocorallia libanotica TaxID=46162 RepID=A0ABP4BN15_9ACTN
MVVLAVELAQFSAESGAHVAHDLLAVDEHGIGEDSAPVFGDEDKMDMQVVDDTSSPAYIGIWSPSW